MRLSVAALAAVCMLVAAPGASAATPKNPPAPITLGSGWEIRDALAAPAPPQPPPPEEGQPATTAKASRYVRGKASQANLNWQPIGVPSVFDGIAKPAEFPGTVKQYRLRFTAPKTKLYSWAFHFEQVRRRATVYLNGRKLGVRVDPYTPFQLPARGLRPGKTNELVVTVDSRKDPYLPEAWWNWGGITRPVTMVPLGRVSVRNLGTMSNVDCKGPASQCRAELLLDGELTRVPAIKPSKTGRPAPPPKLQVSMRSPQGRVTRQTFSLLGSQSKLRHVRERMRIPAPKLWSPDNPQLYSATTKLIYGGRVQQLDRRKVGLRSVDVKQGLLYLNNRQIQLRGAAMHEDFPGHGAALSPADMDTVVRELKEAGANTTRQHYLFSEGLLRRFDKAGIMVWSEAPVWQRDSKKNALSKNAGRASAYAQLGRTVTAARNHASVITHSIGNELSVEPDNKFGTRRYIKYGAEQARRLDPTLPISLDINGRPGHPKQRTYDALDMLGINQYFGWYPWVANFNGLTPYLNQMHAQYPDKALVMTEFGAESRPDMVNAPATQKGSYGFQATQVGRTLDVVDRTPFLSGAIHWTLREFQIFPGWTGGAGPISQTSTLHYKGVLTYTGQHKPAWQVLHDHYVRTPLYR